MKNLLIFTLLAGSLILMSTLWNTEDVETSIQFKNARWEDLLKQAKEEHKIIFVDIYATWCGPCKQLKRTTFTDKAVGDFFNANFINVALDGETEEGRKVADLYEVHSYPTLLFINPNGSLQKVATGYHTSSQLLRKAESIVKRF